ncbi:MAG TPA: ABC transporter permease subunit [Terriglobia bacterium]|nr:ABC transporter permease subunit [Terriglobia bacterium]
MADIDLKQAEQTAIAIAESDADLSEHVESPGRAALTRFLRNRMAVISTAVLALIVIGCFLGPQLFGYAPDDTDFDAMNAPIDLTSAHLLGTDDLGRDMLLRLMSGGQVSLIIGLVATIVAVAIGVLYGSIAGFFGGAVDQVLMRIADILYGVPYIFQVILISVAMGRGKVAVIVAVMLTLWLTPSRIVRAQAITLRNREFIEAARAGGMSRLAIVLRHIMPNCLGVVIVYSSLLVPDVILSESLLSFLGLGVQPPESSWGVLIADGRAKIESDPRMLLIPGLALALTLLCLNFVADGLRDAFDPNER